MRVCDMFERNMGYRDGFAGGRENMLIFCWDNCL